MIKLLTIDDEPDVCEFIRDFFSLRGYQVSTAVNGTAGLELVRKELPNIVFLDIVMADINGLEVLRLIKEFDPKIRVVMVSVSDDAKTRQKATELGADEFIRKPFSKNYLEEVVIKKVIELSPARQ